MIGPVDIIFTAVIGSGITTKDCMEWFVKKKLELNEVSTLKTAEDWMKEQHSDKC